MESNSFFFNPSVPSVHIGGIHRRKRQQEDFNDALYHFKIIVSNEDDQSIKSSSIKSMISEKASKKLSNDSLLARILRQVKYPILPDVLTKDLDRILQKHQRRHQQQIKLNQIYQKSSIRLIESKLSLIHEEENNLSTSNKQNKDQDLSIDDFIDEIPRISLPSSLIVQLNSTWNDLIINANYKYRVWQSKAGRQLWMKYLTERHLRQTKTIEEETIIHLNEEQIDKNHRQSLSNSLTSTRNLSHRPSTLINGKIHSNQWIPRASIISLNNPTMDHERSIQNLCQGQTDSVKDPIKHGLHIEFKFSTHIDKNRIENSNPQKFRLFDLSKSSIDFNQVQSDFIEIRSRNLFNEMKEKILKTKTDTNINRIQFYQESNISNKKKLTLSSIQQTLAIKRTKFIKTILKRSIPEFYSIDIDTLFQRAQSYLELNDGTIQIYYPSGRLAILKFGFPLSTILLYEDNEFDSDRLLCIITSTRNVFIQKPKFYSRFISDQSNQCSYLCDEKFGFINQKIPWRSIENLQRNSFSIVDLDSNNNSTKNLLQFQLNSSMKLQYEDSTNICLQYTYEKEEYRFELGIPSTNLLCSNNQIDVQENRKLLAKSNLLDKRFSISQNLNLNEKQISTNEIPTDDLNHSNDIPMFSQLFELRNKIKDICQKWLAHCRSILGILSIDEYCLSDLPSPYTPSSLSIDSFKNNSPQTFLSTKSIEDELVKFHSLDQNKMNSNHFLSSMNKNPLAEKFSSNIITDSIEQFVPHSNLGKAMKKQIFLKQKLPKLHISTIK